MTWFEHTEAVARPYYEAILELPFIKELIDGTLPLEKFLFYLQQDALYLREYSMVLAHIASRVPTPELTELFMGFTNDCITVERSMHSTYLKDVERIKDMSPSCLLYTSIEHAQATAYVGTEAAAVLPCFKVYLDCGRFIYERVKDCLDSHPYKDWIATYADDFFITATQKAIDACNFLAERVGEDLRREMTDIYVLCTKMEWMFWESAYNLEKWKI